MDVKAVHDYVDAKKDEYFETFKKFVAQPSISSQSIGVRECAQMLKGHLDELGMNGRIIETKGQPAVFGELKCNKPDAFTILFCGHYDVQPPEPYEAWISPPFEPTVRDDRVYGRGVADNKGQVIAHIFAIKSYLETVGEIPINVKYLAEGEEENGSPNFAQLFEDNKELLACDFVFYADGAMPDFGKPSITIGNRGIISFDIDVETATHDNHSGNRGNLIKNAGWELVKILNSMVDDNGKVLIEGFYDDVVPMDEGQKELIDKLDYDPKRFADLFGVDEITASSKEDYYTKLSFLPSLTIDGIATGYAGEGTKTVIPCKARAKFDARLVKNQDCYEVFEKVKAHVKKVNPSAKVTLLGKMWPAATDPTLPAVAKITEAMRTVYKTEPVVIPVHGGSMPAYAWERALGASGALVPYGNPDQTVHAPNENLRIVDFYNGIHASVEVMAKLSEI